MSIFSRLFMTKAASRPTDIETSIENDQVASITVNPYQAFRYYQSSSAVAIAVEMIATKVEDMHPVIKIGGKLVDSDPILDILRQPNATQTRKQFIGDIVRHYLISANSFVMFLGAQRSRSIEMYALHPVGIQPESSFAMPWPERIRVSGDFGQGSYEAEEINRQIAFIERVNKLREIVHIKGFSSRINAVLADSPLEGVMQDIELQLQGKNHNVSLLRNGGRPSLIFNFKGQFHTKEAFRDAVAFLRKQFGGSKKAGAIAGVNSEDLEVIEAGTTNKDMDFAILDEASRSIIFTRYQIPLPLVTASRQTHSNFKEATTAFYYDAVIPTFEAVYRQLGRALLRRQNRSGEEIEITYDPHQIPAIHEEMLAEAEKLSKLLILTVNEQREKLPDTDPIEGGDTVLAPSSLQPVAGKGVDLAEMVSEDRAMQAEMMKNEAEQNNSRHD